MLNDVKLTSPLLTFQKMSDAKLWKGWLTKILYGVVHIWRSYQILVHLSRATFHYEPWIEHILTLQTIKGVF